MRIVVDTKRFLRVPTPGELITGERQMTTLTLRLPDDTHAQLKELARHRGVSLNKLMVELATIAVTWHEAEARFRVLAADGSADMGLDILDKLDHAFRGGEAR